MPFEAGVIIVVPFEPGVIIVIPFEICEVVVPSVEGGVTTVVTFE